MESSRCATHASGAIGSAWYRFASAIAMLAISMFVRVDLGVRLVLPLYPLMAIAGAQGAMELWRSSHTRVARATIAGKLGRNDTV